MIGKDATNRGSNAKQRVYVFFKGFLFCAINLKAMLVKDVTNSSCNVKNGMLCS